jgi:hypothetical protein
MRIGSAYERLVDNKSGGAGAREYDYARQHQQEFYRRQQQQQYYGYNGRGGFQYQQYPSGMNGSPLFYAFVLVAVAAGVLSILPTLLKSAGDDNNTGTQGQQGAQTNADRPREQVVASRCLVLPDTVD